MRLSRRNVRKENGSRVVAHKTHRTRNRAKAPRGPTDHARTQARARTRQEGKRATQSNRQAIRRLTFRRPVFGSVPFLLIARFWGRRPRYFVEDNQLSRRLVLLEPETTAGQPAPVSTKVPTGDLESGDWTTTLVEGVSAKVAQPCRARSESDTVTRTPRHDNRQRLFTQPNGHRAKRPNGLLWHTMSDCRVSEEATGT